MSVLVCLSAGNISVTTHPIFTIFLYITYGRGTVLLWQRCDRLYTSSFMDDVMFAQNRTIVEHVDQIPLQ